MALPDNFSPWEHLQRVLINTQNRRVRQEFGDVGDDSWDNDPSIATPRGSLRIACTLQDNDSAIMTLLRMWLFEITLQGAANLHPPLYTMPSDRYQQQVKFAPQVTMYFREDLEDIEPGFAPIDAEISFRIINETSFTLSEADILALARRIDREFAVNRGYRWHKGRIKTRYANPEQGYLLSLNAYSRSEALEVIRKVLSVQNAVIDESKLTYQEMGETPVIIPPTRQIVGRPRRLPRKRPVGWVRFRYAELHVWGIPKAITLLDLTGRRRNPVIIGS